MFYELIYTRCRQGIDILKKGQQITSDGYKVYSCTPTIMEEGKVDLQFLANASQAKQSFADPGFMDDAYLYYTPNIGANFFVNFFPVPFDANAKGDYSRRPGNFVNHAIIGDFSNFYPYELFKDETVWTAKTKGEAFYYENLPAATGLPERNDINDPPGKYSFEEIGAFIKEGREEALKKAVSFLISQYNEDHKKRKFLVIKEDSSKNIELWIAAIECAFSPKIASRLPFATRMDKFTTTNKYTTKLGLYQTQINLQDPNHIHHYRAMIVGVNEQDKTNAGLARPIANSPFVLLDGKQKKAEFEADISNQYYQFIVRFDDEHRDFCRRNLQDFDLNEPSAGVIELFEANSVLFKSDTAGVRQVSDILDRLSKYLVSNSNGLKNIYNVINKNLPKYLQEDLSIGLKIINWLQNTSKIIGDNNAKQHLTGTVCNIFANLLFIKFDNNIKKSNWELIKNSDFYVDVANVITNIETIKNNQSSIKEFNLLDIKTLLSIYMDAALKSGGINERVMDYFLRVSIIGSTKNNDINSFNEIVQIISKSLDKPIKEFQFQLLKNEKIDNEDCQKFIASYIVEQENIKKAADAEAFIKKLLEIKLDTIEEIALIKIFELLSSKCGTKAFGECMLRMKFSEEDQPIVLDVLSLVSEDLFKEYLKELINNAKKYNEKWYFIVNSVSKSSDKDFENVLIQALVDTKQNEKSLDKLRDLLEKESVQKYFIDVAKKTLEAMKRK